MSGHRALRTFALLSLPVLWVLTEGVVAGAEPSGGRAQTDEVVLIIPEITVQNVLDRASPMEGATPQGIHYSISNPSVTIRQGRILATMDIKVWGEFDLLGREISVTLQGSMDAEIVTRIDPQARAIEGGFEIQRLAIDNLEQLSDAQELKGFLNATLTRFEYPIDIPPTEIPELGMFLAGTITGIDVGDGDVRVRTKVLGGRMPRR